MGRTAWFAMYFLLSEIISICATQYIIPCFNGSLSKHCKCQAINQVVIKASCTVNNKELHMTTMIKHLPTTLRFLTFSTEDGFSDGLSFERFPDLETLEILWEGNVDLIANTKTKSKIQKELFKNLKNLTNLTVNVPMNGMAPDSLLNLTSLKKISLDNAGYLTSGYFANIYRGSKLDEKPLETVSLRRFSHQQTGRVNGFKLKDILPLFNGSKLKNLDISYNKYIYAYPGLLKYTPHLHDLRLAGNVLLFNESKSEVNCGLIELGLLGQLTTLDISDMGVLGVEYDLFAWRFLHELIGSVHLYQQQNIPLHDIQYLCHFYKTFNDCKGYTFNINCNKSARYDLAELTNQSTTCKNGPMPVPPSLENIYMNRTNFGFFIGGVGTKFPSRKTCFFPNNIRVLDVSGVPFGLEGTDNQTLTGLGKVTELRAGNSGWGSYFYNKAFLHDMPSLRILDLSGTQIGTYIATDNENIIFAKTPDLEELYLMNAAISYIPPQEFTALVKLRLLDLSSNELKIPTYEVLLPTSLMFLNLSSTEISSLAESITNAVDSLTAKTNLTIDLTKNRLSCLCEDIAFLKWTLTTKAHLNGRSEYLCTHPSQGTTAMEKVNITSLQSQCNIAWIVTGSILVILLAVIVTVVLLYKYRKQIGYWWLRVKHQRDLDNDAYTNEAFVIYTDEDRFWVHGPLLEKIEREMKMKLCIHHRDFVPGEEIDDQIVTAIKNSRKTIAVLSPSFLESEWCNYELQIARSRLQTEGIDILVPIILTAFPHKTASASLQQILSEKTFLKWEADDEYFWKKLGLALSRTGKLTRKEQGVNNGQEAARAPRVQYNLRGFPENNHTTLPVNRNGNLTEPEPEADDINQIFVQF